ncbi:MAG: heme-binding protein, partial [Planctomycetota bacterium]
TADYPLGIVVKNGEPHFLLSDEIVRFRDTDGDSVPDKRETVFKGFDDPELAAAPYLHHRRVDSAMGLALGPDDSWYITMGNAGFSNPYWYDGKGNFHYSTDKRRGCLLHIGNDGTIEQVASGLRYVMSMQTNKHGDLFATDQEGATWVPNGNPFDELLHVQPRRHYGFPPRHPKHLPDVVDEPSVWDYDPQHQSTCGFRFNSPAAGRGRFGPEFWEDDAIVTGESRGKLWRTKLTKTAAGYVATTQLFASMNLLVVDCAISPAGDLVICCHTGKPDWGNGPAGKGRVFKISYTDQQAPLPVMTWAKDESTTVVSFSRALDAKKWADSLDGIQIAGGHYVQAADRLERMRPSYTVVGYQQAQARQKIQVASAKVNNDGQQLIIKSDARTLAFNYSIDVPELCDVAHDLSGLEAEWHATAGKDEWTGWLPHPDIAVARTFTSASATHDELWENVKMPGELTLRAQLNLANLLQPATQPTSQLDYEPTAEDVTLIFKSDAAVSIEADDAKVVQKSGQESHVTVTGPTENVWLPVQLTVTTPVKSLDVSFSTSRDSRQRALPIKRVLMPFAKPAPPTIKRKNIPQIAGGNWEAGHEIFVGKATCSKCHVKSKEGQRVGPDLDNLIHRDYVGVLNDIINPSATINPDAVGYNVILENGKTVSGTRVADTDDELHIVPSDGKVVRLKKSEISEIQPMKISAMPAGLEKLLSTDELRDLMTFLLLTKPKG